MRCFDYSGLVPGSFLKLASQGLAGPGFSAPGVSRGEYCSSQQNQQLDLVGGCNAIIPRDFVVWESCSTPTAPTILTAFDSIHCSGE